MHCNTLQQNRCNYWCVPFSTVLWRLLSASSTLSMAPRVRVRCSVLQRVAACCSVLQRGVVCCCVLQWCIGLPPPVLPQWPPGHVCVAVCCSVLHCGAVCCIVLQCCRGLPPPVLPRWPPGYVCVAMCCNVLQCVTMCCNALYNVAEAFYLPHSRDAPNWSALQHVAARCTGWQLPIECLLQLSCRSFCTKKPPIFIGLFCGEWSIKISHPMTLCHSVGCCRVCTVLWRVAEFFRLCGVS